MAVPNQPIIALTIAGSDSGGGAGIQADLKTFHAHGVHGLSAIAAITSQNTRGVTAVHPVPLLHIRSQIEAVFDDFPIAAVKTGMLGNAATVRLVAKALRKRKPAWVVIDPVMISTSGSRLLDEDAIEAVIKHLIPLADVLTPNLPEAEALLGHRLRTTKQLAEAGHALLALGARGVLLKGGHGRGNEVIDRYFDKEGTMEIRHARLPREGHGTGCTLASAIAAELAKGATPRQAVRRAVAYVQRALKNGYRPGSGTAYVLHH
ncbi:bifunctional hydroxymethylpyrimidine kinase/phosphomethylpyrimidine kinase [Dyella nitratireducens]|uniref:hydroxymethylpyrimidine kinase n=1 Tax=Dyella nitratireducens TaxID=1849580 RepID=A0ABQ1FKP4_9GAMM|nr:bifunctional hydroxymethylpyrimidine kinase/phosphomethylpyrimidine kinase [Dyella nitratireducens]GGA19012.1 hydroxymethylpyrimidine/phosphomethylpyrimidine kinase [Dyella nitratireducens]GLQ44575.1 hydroxymethylpyrimidine/phosphomethylpyrimidine kinase [Dyella nitratireducens]